VIAGAVSLIASQPQVNPNAVPTGVGRSPWYEPSRDRAMNQPLPNSTFGPAPAEERPNTGCAELYHSPFSYFGRKKN